MCWKCDSMGDMNPAENGISDRNNVRQLDSKQPYMITYVGPWAVQTELVVDDDTEPSPELVRETAKLVARAMVGEDVSAEAEALRNTIPLRGKSLVHRVGEGTISDAHPSGRLNTANIDHVETALPGDDINGDGGMQALHARLVDLYYEKK